MSAQNRYATLESELMGKGAEAPPALPSRRRTADRITGRVTPVSAAAPSAPAPAAAEPTATRAMAPAPAVEPSPGDVFYDKGAATADNFRPAYWTYDRATPGATPQGPAPAAAPVETKRVIELAPAEPAPIAARAAMKEQRREPPAVAGAPDTAAVADELAATIEHVLGSRYAGTRTVPEAEPKPRLVASAVTADSLMAELKQARQSRAPDDKPAASSRSAHRPKKAPPSFLDRAFLFGGFALVLFVLLVLSPWRDTFLSPSIAHFFG